MKILTFILLIISMFIVTNTADARQYRHRYQHNQWRNELRPGYRRLSPRYNGYNRYNRYNRYICYVSSFKRES